MNPLLALLHAMELVAEGNVRNPDSSGGGKPESRPPRTSKPLRTEFEERLRGCDSLKALEGWRSDAREALRDAKRAKAPQRAEKGTVHWKREIANRDDVGIAEVARLYSVSRMTVYRYREQYRGDLQEPAA